MSTQAHTQVFRVWEFPMWSWGTRGHQLQSGWVGAGASAVQFHKWETEAHSRAIQPSWQGGIKFGPCVPCAWGQGPRHQENTNLL